MSHDQEAEEFNARLVVYEYCLEVLMARVLAGVPEPISDRFKAELINNTKDRNWGPLTGDRDLALKLDRMSQRVPVILERLLTKVARREKQMRVGQGPRPKPH